MYLSEVNIPANKSLPSEMLLRLLEQYVSQKNKLQEKQADLRLLYNRRPRFIFFPDQLNASAYLLALDYYRSKLFRCLQEITDIENNLEDTKTTISEFVPANGKLFTVPFKEDFYLMGFLRLSQAKNKFFLVKKNNHNPNLPTYLPTNEF